MPLCFPLSSQVYDVVFEDALEIFEPSPLPEGDLIRVLTYTPDGSMLAALYQHSDNIYFYNTTTYALLAIVDVGREPMDITMSNQSAYVCCHTSNELYIINLSDFSISNTFEVYENPCQVEIKQDETVVYVGCESSTYGSVAAYNTSTGEEIFHTFEPKIYLLESLTALGRHSDLFTYFSLSPHSNYIIAINSSDKTPSIFNGSTGELVKKFNFGEMKGSGFSETGDTLYIFSAQSQDSMSIHRVNINGFSVIDSIVAVTTRTSFGQNDLAINADGTKVLIADGSGYCLFDFNLYNYQHISDLLIFIMDKMFTSNDKEYAIYRAFGGARFIDLETGQIISQLPVGYPVGMAGAISPIADKMAFGDGPLYSTKYYPEEKFYIFDIADPTNIIVDTVIISGIAPEADVTNSAVLSIDGSKIIASNMLTNNISIIDYASGQFDGFIYMEGVSDIKIIPNTDFILASGKDAVKVKIINLANYEIISELITGYVDELFVSEDGEYAYTLTSTSASAAIVKKIELNGASSEIVGVLQVAHNNCTYQPFYFDEDIHSKAALSPDGNYLLFGSKDDTLGEVVHILNTQLMEVVKTIPINSVYGDCVYGYAFTDDSKRVCALNGPQIPIIYLDGANSFLESEVSIDARSFSADYNPIDGLFYILLQSDWSYKVNPENGEILDSIPTTSDTYVQLDISQNGIPLIRAFRHLLFNDVIYPLPGASQDFSFNEANNLYVIPIPGPDKICVFNPLVADVKTYPEPTTEEGVIVFPNPASNEVLIYSANIIESVKIYNLAGKLVFSKDCNKLNTSISTSNYAEGAYLIVTKNADGISTRKLIVVH